MVPASTVVPEHATRTLAIGQASFLGGSPQPYSQRAYPRVVFTQLLPPGQLGENGLHSSAALPEPSGLQSAVLASHCTLFRFPLNESRSQHTFPLPQSPGSSQNMFTKPVRQGIADAMHDPAALVPSSA